MHKSIFTIDYSLFKKFQIYIVIFIFTLTIYKALNKNMISINSYKFNINNIILT